MKVEPIVNALSIDVEEYFQVSAFESVIAPDHWERWPSRVEFATHQLLDLYAEVGVRATFFTLGWVAERHPQLIARMCRDGHEVACHGYNHTRATTQSRAEFKADIARSKAILEDAAGSAVLGYRAASFSIDATNLWAFPEIEAAGFIYSSSVYPVRHDLYGAPAAPRSPFVAPHTSALTEIPVSTVRIGMRNLPAGGGGFFRLLPYVVSRALIKRVNSHDHMAANMYFHPWEFDPQQPRPPGVGLKSQFRHYLNQGRALARMRALVNDFAWAPFREVYADVLGGRCGQTVGSEAFARS
ncbi:MAG: DUF3473 domain-containing protein [Proteobacteria bacterium]|nr:DUF3473 domain-containing protein [Pseudomonadota bacterium]